MSRFVAAMPVLVVVLLASACAQQEARPQADASSYPVMRTGSNIPVARERAQAHRDLTDAERKFIEDELERPRGAKVTGN